MQSSNFLSVIESRYPPEVGARITAAMRQDDLIWNALDDEEFCQRALDADRNSPVFWSPANLGLVALGMAGQSEALIGNPTAAIEAGVRQQALKMFEEVTRRAIQPTNLRDAALLALALRERLRLTGSWNGIANELLYSSVEARATSGRVWRTALACLFGLVAGPKELVAALLKARDSGVAADWIVHILVTLPMDDDSRAEKLVQFLAEVPTVRQIDVLKIFRLRAGDLATNRAAGQLLSGHPMFSAFRMKIDLDQITPEGLANRILTLQQLAIFNQLAGSPAQAEACLRLARAAMNYWQAGLDLQSLNNGGDEPENAASGFETLSERILALLPVSKRMAAEVGALVVQRPMKKSSFDQGEAAVDDPMVQLSKALSLQQAGESGQAKEIGQQAAAGFMRVMTDDVRPFLGDFVYTWTPMSFIRGLVTLGLNDAAADCAELSLGVHPNDPAMLTEFTELLLATGKYTRAKKAARLAVALVPNSLDLRRKLAHADEKAGDWEAAFYHRKNCLQFKGGQGNVDKLLYARAAIHTTRPVEAAQTCQEILVADPDYAGAHGWLGMAMAKMGKRDQAAAHLERATLLAPDEADWWLMLSDMYKQAGERRQAHESLRAAVMAAPEAGEVYAALADLLLDDGLSSEALPYLKRADDLLQDDEKIALRLCRVYRQLGHLAEARKVADKLRHKWAAAPELAYEYACIAGEQADGAAAIPALEVAVRSELVQPEWMLTYAQVLLDDQSNEVEETQREVQYEQAEHMLSKVLAKQPNDYRGRLMMADVLRQKGSFEKALSLYQHLAEEPEFEHDDLLWRIQRGLGLTALALNMVEPALASIKDAAIRQPGRLELQQDLAKAYMAAVLPYDAINAAENALEIAPHDLRNLDWYAESMVKLGQPTRAEDALRMAVELSPENMDLRLRLAQVQMQNGDQVHARQTLSSVANEARAVTETLRQAAYIYIRMDDLSSALECFEKAVSRSVQPAGDLMFDLAKLYDRLGKPVESLEAIQKVAIPSCRDAKVFVFQAGLLSRNNRIQAAQASLERALKLVEHEPDAKRLPLEGEIYREISTTQMRSGSLTAALFTAEKALERVPGDLRLRAQTAKLALSLLQIERAKRLSASVDIDNAHTQDGADLAMIQAEAALEMGDFGDAARAWESAIPNRSGDPWLSAIESRLLGRNGDWVRSANLARKAVIASETPSYPSEKMVWIGKSAVEAGLWKEGIKLLDKFRHEFPSEPLAAFEFARALALAAERKRDCDFLSSSAHRPDPSELVVDAHAQFRASLEEVGQFCPSPDVTRWLLRGELAFAPSAQGVKDFSRMATTPDDTAAIVRALRETGNWPSAALAAQKHPHAGSVQIQICMGYFNEDPELGLEIASELVEKQPQHPLLQALRAKLAEKVGNLPVALNALTNAVGLWPDESAWQANLGDLADQVGEHQSAIRAWKAAVQFQPSHPAYNLALGRAYLAVGDFPAAIGALDRAANLAQGSVEGWLDLANAYKMNGNLTEAMEAAQHASDVNLTDVRGVLLSSEISREMGETEMAGEYARLAIRREPKNPDAVLALSKALTQQGLQKESLEEIESHLAELPTSLPLLFERAQLVYRLNGAAAASSLLMKLAQNFPDEADVLALLARVQLESDDVKGAERSAFRSLRLNPNQPDLSLMLGKLHRKSGQLDQAMQLLTEAIKVRPETIEAYLELGYTFQERREHAAALEVFRRAMKAAPKDPRGYYHAALIFKDSKDYISAEKMLQQAAKLDPNDLQVRRQLIAVMALNLIHKSQEASTIV
jgi:tetratricopeptide (TPR) repeat protein